MPEFMPEPKVHLTTAEELIDYLSNHPDNHCNNQFYPPSKDDVNETKSDFLCDCIRELESNGKFPYNCDVWMLARKKLGLEEIDYNFWWDNQREYPFSYKILYIMVCRASQYKSSDDLISNGFVPVTQEMIDQAGINKKKIKTQNGTIYNIKKIGESWYAMKPYARNYALSVQGQPVKII
jgi:hypothetical protein